MASERDFTNMQEVLRTQLKKLFDQSPEYFSVPVHTLAAVDDSVEGQFEQLLQQESRDHTGERTVLIPYLLKNLHWIGMVIGFHANGQVTRAEYIDPVNGMNTVPNRLQNRFTKIYPDIILQKRDLLKQDDPRCSAMLTIENLLAAIKNDHQTSDGKQSTLCAPEENIQDGISMSEIRQETEETEKKMKVFQKVHPHLRNRREDLNAMPICAERTIFELLLRFEEGTSVQQKNAISTALQNLKDQLKREELLSENNRIILQNLEICIASNDCPSVVRCLKELIKQIRSLNLPEICRLVEKSKEAAELIRDKEIILLVGETGTGKSTTIQFLAGSTMEQILVEIAPGKFLEHITAVGPIKNPQLNNVISSPLCKSETRHITPVTIPLKDIFGAQENGFMTLCDTPGFEDTAGSEVDIANSIGMIEALKGTKSVKILALSSYQGLGDRGEGIHKLAHILISMVDEIQDRLDAIFYAFTKYPKKIDINALLIDIKTSRVNSDPTLRADSAFVTVLTDMIDKTEVDAFQIDPIHDDPKRLLRKLKRIRGIAYPSEVFRLSMSQETRTNLANHLHRDKFSLICAMKHKDLNLVLYYLNDLKILHDLIKETLVRDTYEDSKRLVSESISEYYTDVMEKFNRTLTSQDGLTEKDILDYKISLEYLEQSQILKEHLGSSLPSSETLMQNLIATLQESHDALKREELHSLLVSVYLNNLRMLKNSFAELETYYSSSCKEWEQCFKALAQSACEPIRSNDFKQVGEIFLKLSKCLPILKNYLGEQIEDKYREIIQFLLQHLNDISKATDARLIKVRLNNSDIEVLRNHIDLLQSMKENPVLQEAVSTYLEMLKRTGDSLPISKDFSGIYEELIEKISKYVDNLTAKINELIQTNRDHTLEDIEKLVNDIDALRTLPDFPSKTAEKYYRIAENIRGYMQRLKTNAEQLIVSLQQQQPPSKTINYKQLERLLSPLKNAAWIDRMLPGTHDAIMHHLTDELVEHVQQLEIRLKKLDLSLKCPNNISIAIVILETIELMRILERSIPELEQHRIETSDYFQQCIQSVFDRIRKTFDLENRIIDDRTFVLNERENVHTANNALIYLNQCEKVSDNHLRDSATQCRESLQKYIGEYGQFLNQEINRTFQYICSIDENLSRYSQELGRYLEALSLLSKFPPVFECIDGKETVDHWHRVFDDYYRTLSANLEGHKSFGKNQDFRDQLILTQALSCVDRFCIKLFGNHGFDDLYRRYQIKMTRFSKEACNAVREYLAKEDYAKADIVLYDIDQTLLNSKDLHQIKHDLENSLTQLMKKTKSKVIWLDIKPEREKDHPEQIKEIKENIDQIRLAANKSHLMDLLDDQLRNDLRSFDKEMNDILSEMILKGFSAMEVYIDTDHFFEAEQGLENLNRIQRDLTNYCTALQITEKSEELRGRLDRIVNDILKREEVTDVKTYSVHPPKDLLDKLKVLAKHGNAKYQQVYLSVLTNVRKNITSAMEKARLVPLDERYGRIRTLNHTLCLLPEDLQLHFKPQIDDLNKLIVDEEKGYSDDSNLSLAQMNDDEPAIIKIGSLARRYKIENMHDCFDILREQTLTDLHTYEANVQNLFDQQEPSSAIEIAQKILKYQALVGEYFPEIEQISNTIRHLISKAFLNCCTLFANISSIEQIDIIDKAFSHLIIYLHFSKTFDQTVKEFFPENVLENARELLQKCTKYFLVNSQQYKIALREMNFVELDRVMTIAKKWNEFLKKVHQCQLEHHLTELLLKELAMGISYTDMISQLEETINQLASQLNTDLVDDENNHMKFAEDLSQNTKNANSILRAKNSKFQDMLPSTLNMEKLEEGLRKKVEQIGNKLVVLASNTTLLSRDADAMLVCYDYLSLFNPEISLPGIQIRHFLDLFAEKMFERVTFLYRELPTSLSEMAELFIKMRYFAEKFPIFKTKIHAKIDELLSLVQIHPNHSEMKQLIRILDRSKIGRRLINEHDYLSGKDWQRRREKMQNQDHLVYVLENLYGDDVDKNMLAICYNTFQRTYEDLKFHILRSFNSSSDNEPDLGILITQTKRIAEAIVQSFTSVAWDFGMIERIIQLIAHLFAVWTLKNTQYYTTTRPYLLLPHTAQVIAVFRLLGIGYDTRGQISSSKLLVNNVAEMGTGEGKSVVLAITACAFALIGLDVNCVCYSEVLSLRDRNNYIAVFRALDIEERIVYETFDQLCGQLFQEQGDLREKIREMILNNKTVLTVDKIKLHTHSNALLIDEVDVFFNEQFYGSMYTPSVVVKSPQIKTLLDALWQDQTVQTLDEVKALPSYKTCATEYSHWMFLFDEAIKEMLMALPSFQSSAYLVQNDKIVYMDGESMADNVLHGYNTIWAYYHENKKGTISQRSLKDNVGILVNCGTFSYAELPHHFYYIAGVTGTLRTLAEPEKDILRREYAVHRNTYLPSIFGKSHRTFNPATDLHVVEECAYFKSIRREIDLVCQANRAIVVFFESEEKLMAFYHCFELSSIQHDVQIITEKVSLTERELRIERAGTTGRVTLLTRIFGRGIDFVCRDQQLLAHGGIHVLQTFFSEEPSEEYQIMGRGARQGERGSYCLILLDKYLQWLLGSVWKKELSKISDSNLYQLLDQARHSRYRNKCVRKSLDIGQCQHEHRKSVDFMFALCTGEIKTVKRFLSEQNRDEDSLRSVYRQFCS